ncbi:MAG: phosphatidate cytidylyltransferase [Rhodanobacter sp.]|jgi:phosphatidate cytidylyltransferase|nr:phosphatidate cytidylyltransferase [Rhodanobacter sp.]
MLKQRTLTALIIAPLAIAMILWAPTAFVAAIIGVLCLLAQWEWTRLAGVKSTASRVGIVLANAAAMVVLWRLREDAFAWWVIGGGLAWWMVALQWMRHLSYAAAPTLKNALIKLVACEFAILPAWLALMKLHGGANRGHAWALFVVMLVWAADTMAYFTGQRYGTTKLAPRLSPNKTTAGAWGALLGAGAIALIGAWLLDLRGVHFAAIVALSLLTVIASIAGDLFESLLKRQANVKDSGVLFPGHGGMLDRFDSMFAALPVFVAGKALFDLVFAS